MYKRQAQHGQNDDTFQAEHPADQLQQDAKAGAAGYYPLPAGVADMTAGSAPLVFTLEPPCYFRRQRPDASMM